MARKRVEGTCVLCGKHKLLSFEHVPPAAAYNRFPRFLPDMHQFIAHRYRNGPPPAWTDEPEGAGAYTLCTSCNTHRCARYALHFVPWAVDWQDALDTEPTKQWIRLSQRIYRSRIMKQLVAMFLSANSPKMGAINPGLRRFVWNAQVTGLPEGIRVHAALTRDKTARQAGVTGQLNTETGKASTYSEIAFAPLILVMTFAGDAPPDARLVDITFMANGGYCDLDTTELPLPVLTLRDFYPGAYL